MPPLKEKQLYTYEDYCNWEDGDRWELINGEAIVMSPAPLRLHQRTLLKLAGQFLDLSKNKAFEVNIAPFDVRLNADSHDDTIVQPDLVIVCDSTKLDDRGCKGVPDMIVEVLSPSSVKHDRFVKLHLYQKAGVCEYWIVDPDSKTVSVYILENGKYIAAAYCGEDIVTVRILQGCKIALSDVFNPFL